MNQTQIINNTIFNLSSLISTQTSNLQQSLRSILQIVNFDINRQLNIFEQLSLFKQELPQFQNSLDNCLKHLDNSNYDLISQFSFSLKTQNIYSKLITHQQQIHELSKLISFQTTQTQTIPLLPYFSEIYQQFSQELQSLSDIQNLFSTHKNKTQSFNLSSISQSLNQSIQSNFKKFDQYSKVLSNIMNLLYSNV
jgi:hypothetical protein